MKFLSQLLISLCLVLLCAGTSGCASKTIDAAATKIKIGGAEIQLAKNIDTEAIEFTYDPETKRITFKAAKLKSDASGVVDSASKMQAEALGKLADTVTALAPLVK